MISTYTTLNIDLAAPKKVDLKSLLARLIAWLVEKDQAYRANHHVASLTDTQLKDVGLTR